MRLVSIALCAFACLTPMSASKSHAASIKHTTFGCLSKDDFSRAMSLKREGDNDAFKNFLVMKSMDNECIVLDAGQKVILEHTDTGLICVRPKGETSCLWTFEFEVSQN